MKKITHEGQEYEVLPLDDFKGVGNQPDHARLPSGKVVEVNFDNQYEEFYCRFGNGIPLSCWEDLGIQPLKLLPKVPVEFLSFATIEETKRGDLVVLCANHEATPGMKFRCVEVTE